MAMNSMELQPDSQEKLEEALEVPGKKEVLLQLLPEIPDPSSLKVFDRYSIVYLTAQNKWWDVVRKLGVEYGCFPSNLETDEDGNTVLHCACKDAAANAMIIEYLATTCLLNPLLKNKDGETPLCWSTGEKKGFLNSIVDEAKKVDTNKKTSELDKVAAYLKRKRQKKILELANLQVKNNHNPSVCIASIYGLPASGKSSLNSLLMTADTANTPTSILSVVNLCGDTLTSEALNLLYRNRSNFVVAIRLTDDLDTVHRHSTLTNASLINEVCHTATVIAARTSFAPKVFIVGTYDNKMKEDPLERCRFLSEKLIRLVDSKYQHVFACSTSTNNCLVYHVNISTKDPNGLRCHILQHANDSTKRLPWNWLIFHKRLFDMGVVSLSTCYTVARRLGIVDEVPQALHVLNDLAMIIYHPTNDDLIIADMNIINKKLTRITRACAPPRRAGMPNEHAIAKTKGTIACATLKRAFGLTEDQLSNECFVKLLLKLNIAVPIDKKQIFLPCTLLSHASLQADKKIFDNKTPSFIIIGDKGSLPPGFFLNLAADLCNETSKDITTFEVCIGYQFGNKIQLKPKNKSISGLFNLVKMKNCIIVSITEGKWCDIPAILTAVDNALRKGVPKFEYTGLATPPIIRLTCPMCSTKDHCCYVYQIPEHELQDCLLACSENKDNIHYLRDFEDVLKLCQDVFAKKCYCTIHPEKDNSIDDSTLLPNECHYIDVHRAINDIPKWFDLGISLGLKLPDLEKIKLKRLDDADSRREVVSSWLDTDKASWKKLAIAVMDEKTVNNKEIGVEICKQHLVVPKF